ncbi:unnamed protein product, partial [Pylaiella littoralis]
GKEPATVGGALLCFACWRPGPRDESSIRWIHVGSGPYWAELWKWSTAVGAKWSHERDLKAAPLQVGECICRRPDCVRGMYHNFKLQRLRDVKGSLSRMEVGQSSQ